MPRLKPNRNPTFFWQGLLILLPVTALAAFGFRLLHQDRKLAETDAEERAQAIAEQVLQNVSGSEVMAKLADIYFGAGSGSLRTGGNSVPAWHPEDGIEAGIRAPMLDEIFSNWPAAPGGEVWSGVPVKLDGNGKLLHLGGRSVGEFTRPPLYPQTLELNALDENSLDDSQRELWKQAHLAEFSSFDSKAPIQVYERFLALSPPDGFRRTADYAIALLLAKSGDADGARQRFRGLQDAPGAVNSSGLPLATFARLQNVQLLCQQGDKAGPAASNIAAEIDLLCSNAVHNPSPFTPNILEKASQLERLAGFKGESAAQKWTYVWQTDEGTRDFFQQNKSEFTPEKPGEHISWTCWNGKNWLSIVTRSPDSEDGGSFNVLVYPELMVREAIWEIFILSRAKLPRYFGVSAQLAGREVLSVTNSTRVLATAFGKFLGDRSPANDLTLSVHLGDPTLLYANQRTRTLWLAVLITMAAVAALIGFFAARRAFYRQLRLSDMKSDFVSSVSHELRAPIASVRLMAEGLERGKISEPGKQKEYFAFIVQECRRLSSLIENVLDFSRIEQGRKQYEMEFTDLAALTEQTVKLMETYASERQVTIAFRKTGEPMPVELDGKAIQQALINLIDNAIKHSPKGAEITVGLEFGEEKSQPCSHPDSNRDGHVRLWVEDKGDGIPASEHARIFERFYRVGPELRRETQGVGIGLSIVKHIVESHGGKVTVRSAPREGSRFTIELPAGSKPV